MSGTVAVACVAALLLAVAIAGAPLPGNTSFVTRNGYALMLDGARFRFGGANMYWLGLDQNVPPGHVAYPTKFRVDDALHTAVLMGATVVRAHTLGISTGSNLSFEPRLSVWNHAALESIDYAVYRAGELGLKLIVPLTDNWHYYHGGKHDFTDWIGVPEADFYSNTRVIAAFKDYIKHLLQHVNRYTGRRYCDEPAVLAWETGNELMPPANWTADIAAFLKALDPKHLVLSGHHGVAAAELPIAAVDMYSDHYYPMRYVDPVAHALECQAANKTFIVGEFGWPDGDLPLFLDLLRNTTGVSGDLYWSFFPHLGAYGFEQHGDGFTLHYPGDDAAMFRKRRLLQDHAYAMAGRLPLGSYNVTQAPLLHPINGSAVSWRGAWGACSYEVERSTGGGSFTVVLRNVTDNDVPVHDATQRPGVSYTYRVVPLSCSGDRGAPSNERSTT